MANPEAGTDTGQIADRAFNLSRAVFTKQLFHVEDLERDAQSAEKILLNLDNHDLRTACHSRSVAELAEVIAWEMDLSDDRIEKCRIGAAIHDYGKIYTSPEVLNSSRLIEEADRKKLRDHPRQGYRLAEIMYINHDSASIVRYHHEKLDGTGYPDKLAGEAIPLGARITAVADAIDGWIFGRTYIKATSAEEAFRIISASRGSHFDPEVLDACGRVFRHGFTYSQYLWETIRSLGENRGNLGENPPA